jgi:predicted ABC-type ATPase
MSFAVEPVEFLPLAKAIAGVIANATARNNSQIVLMLAFPHSETASYCGNQNTRVDPCFIRARLAGELGTDAYQAAEVAAELRQEFASQRESFVFEIAFSDPVGDKLSFLKNATRRGYTVVLCFIGIADADRSEERIALRVSQVGHDVPTDKLNARFPRTMSNPK